MTTAITTPYTNYCRQKSFSQLLVVQSDVDLLDQGQLDMETTLAGNV